MAKSRERNRAIELRKRGESIKDIARRVKVSKGTVSVWCRDIQLTPDQAQKLHDKMVECGHKGRMLGARMQYKRRLEKIEAFKRLGFRHIGKLSNRNLLIAGIALYWGEGSKKTRVVAVSNSDPEVIKFMMNWFRRVWQIDDRRFSPYVGINQIHRNRVDQVEEYWSRVTRIPREQFTKTILIKAENKKNYKNFPVHYGTLTIRVRKSADLYYQILGLIDGLCRRC